MIRSFVPKGSLEIVNNAQGVAMNPPPPLPKVHELMRKTLRPTNASAKFLVGLYTTNPPPPFDKEPVLVLPDNGVFAARHRPLPSAQANFEWPLEAVLGLVFELRRDQVQMAIDENYGESRDLWDVLDPATGVTKHAGDVGASFMYQKGFFQGSRDHSVTPEPSVQISVLNTIGEPENYFFTNMNWIAHELAVRLIQWSVLMEYAAKDKETQTFDFQGRE